MHFRRSQLIFFIAMIFVALPFAARAQGDQFKIEPSYDVILQVVIGGDEKGGTKLPNNLDGIAKQLKANYQFNDYKLANTYVGRIANQGNFEFKSLTNMFGRPAEAETPSFLEWSIAGMRTGASTSGKNDIYFNVFRFGARIPVRTGYTKDDSAKQFPVVNYEAIGLSSARLTLAESTPTLIGSLSLPTSDNAMFLVLTLKPA